MNNLNFKIDGIYDEGALKSVMDQGVRRVSFDLRPKSFNFIQIYRIQEILKSVGDLPKDFKVYLHFQDESEFSIKYIVDEIAKTIGNHSQIRVYLSDQKDITYYQNLKHEFSWELTTLDNLKQISLTKGFREVILPFELVEFYHGRNQAFEFLNRLMTMKKDQFELCLKIPWDFDKIESIFDFYQFDSYLLSVNSKIENSFRNFNHKAMSGLLDTISNQLTFDP